MSAKNLLNVSKDNGNLYYVELDDTEQEQISGGFDVKAAARNFLNKLPFNTGSLLSPYVYKLFPWLK